MLLHLSQGNPGPVDSGLGNGNIGEHTVSPVPCANITHADVSPLLPWPPWLVEEQGREGEDVCVSPLLGLSAPLPPLWEEALHWKESEQALRQATAT